MAMDRNERAERWLKWKRFQQENSQGLLKWAEANGIVGDDEQFVLAETFSRVVLAKALRKQFPDCKIIQMGLYDHYDIKVENPLMVVEGKFRLNDDNAYPTDDLTMAKADYIAMVDEGCPAYVVDVFYNGVVRAYNIADGNEGVWTHSSTTAESGYEKTESKLCYNPSDAVWTTNITLPIL